MGGGTIDRMSEQSQGHDDKGDWKIRKDIDLYGYAKHGSDSEWDKVYGDDVEVIEP